MNVFILGRLVWLSKNYCICLVGTNWLPIRQRNMLGIRLKIISEEQLADPPIDYITYGLTCPSAVERRSYIMRPLSILSKVQRKNYDVSGNGEVYSKYKHYIKHLFQSSFSQLYAFCKLNRADYIPQSPVPSMLQASNSQADSCSIRRKTPCIFTYQSMPLVWPIIFPLPPGSTLPPSLTKKHNFPFCILLLLI